MQNKKICNRYIPAGVLHRSVYCRTKVKKLKGETLFASE